MNKRLITVCLLLSAITIIIVLIELGIVALYKYNNYSYNENDKVVINSYETKYTMENIIADYYDKIRIADESDIEKVFIEKSKIDLKNINKISNIYGLQYYEYDLVIENIYCLSEEKDIYSCEYLLDYSSNVMSDGLEVVIGQEKEPITYDNEIIVKLIEDNKYKILYSKFDLGGGIYYEK